jgi:hypothetical protein
MRWRGYRLVPRLSQNFCGSQERSYRLVGEALPITGLAAGDHPVEPKPFSPRCVSVRSSVQMALGMIIRSTIS